MERINTKIDDYFEGIPKSAPIMGEDDLQISFPDFSSMMTEALFVLDFQKRSFLYVSPHNLFLCGYSIEKVKDEGYYFFRSILHPDDLPQWIEIHVAILKSLYNNKLSTERINYFGCTLRLRNLLSYKDNEPDYLMVYLKIKPKFQDGIPLWGICLLSISVVPKSGNLCVFYDNHDYSIYSFLSGKWSFHPFVPLSKREKQILIWGQAGLSNKEMAGRLHLSVKLIEKIKTSLFEKQSIVDEHNLNSFSKKNQYANNRRLIY